MSEIVKKCDVMDNCCEPEYCCDKKSCTMRPNRTTIKCGCPGAVTLPLATIAGTSFNLANVNVDTKNFNKPCILFQFASNIVTTAGVLSLNFQVFKQCKNQLNPIPIGPVWSFSRLVSVTESNTFSFSVCDCDNCDDDCCNYSVTATVVGVATVGVTSINNATLSAIVVDNPAENCCCCY